MMCRALQVRRVKRVTLTKIETHSLPMLTRSYPRRFTFYVAHPARSVAGLVAASEPVDALLGTRKSSRAAAAAIVN